MDLKLVGLVSVVLIMLAALLYDDGGGIDMNTDVARSTRTSRDDVKTEAYTRSTYFIPFDAHASLNLEAWLYRPVDVNNPPVVVMAHGLALVKDAGLEGIARIFCDSGLAVLTFDHRNFGGSDGLPRHNIKVAEQINDWEKVLLFVRNNITDINNNKIAVWGASIGSGNALAVSSTSLPLLKKNNVHITAVVLNQPIVDAFSLIYDYHWNHLSKNYGTGILLGIKDLLTSYFNKNTYVKIAAAPTENRMSVIHAADWKDYLDLVPSNVHGGWENKLTARSMFQLILSRPALYASQVEVPTLVTLATKDNYASERSVKSLVSSLKHATLKVYDTPSFKMFVKDSAQQKQIGKDQAEFLKKHLSN